MCSLSERYFRICSREKLEVSSSPPSSSLDKFIDEVTGTGTYIIRLKYCCWLKLIRYLECLDLFSSSLESSSSSSVFLSISENQCGGSGSFLILIFFNDPDPNKNLYPYFDRNASMI